jgi:hypothetical protein
MSDFNNPATPQALNLQAIISTNYGILETLKASSSAVTSAFIRRELDDAIDKYKRSIDELRDLARTGGRVLPAALLDMADFLADIERILAFAIAGGWVSV